jgi:hypothetical protein
VAHRGAPGTRAGAVARPSGRARRHLDTYTLWSETLTITNSRSLISSRFGLMALGCMVTTAAPQVVNKTSMALLVSLPIDACSEQSSNNFNIRQSNSTADRGQWLNKRCVRCVPIADIGYARSTSGITMCTGSFRQRLSPNRSFRRSRHMRPESYARRGCWLRMSNPGRGTAAHPTCGRNDAIDYVVNGQGDEQPSFDD